MTYLEGTTYKLQADYYESIKLECTYVEDNTVWFSTQSIDLSRVCPSGKEHYKLNRKNDKLYKLNQVFSSYDLVENTLSEDKVDIWQARSTHRYVYDGSDQTLNGDD